MRFVEARADYKSCLRRRTPSCGAINNPLNEISMTVAHLRRRDTLIGQ
jgi:hypothetical protein